MKFDRLFVTEFGLELLFLSIRFFYEKVDLGAYYSIEIIGYMLVEDSQTFSCILFLCLIKYA